ncbi:MAG TPA: hypothetical protein VGM42_12450 [Rhodopila sp.]|jgi:hypothetical protein
MYRLFSAADAESILRSSEGSPTQHRGTGAPGHPGSRHLLLSNAELLARYQQMSEQRVWKNGRMRRREFMLITAFCNLAEMIDAATLVLNATQTQTALVDLFVNTPRSPGMRVEIAYRGEREFRMRYAQGAETVRVFPVRDLLMVLDRVDSRPFGIQIQTFFGTITDQPRNSATIYSSDGKPRHSHFMP